jgi:hypothetical protein
MLSFPGDYICSGIARFEEHNQRVVSNVFRFFNRDKGQNGRKKIFLLIAGSYLADDNSEQFYPNYLKDAAATNPDCDFLVLNVDPNDRYFAGVRMPNIPENITLRFLSGIIQPLKSKKFYREIANGLQHFSKVIFCSHTDPLGFLYFHSLHRHCQKQDIDCMTIGAYYTPSPCLYTKRTCY